jgi:photosystem II stability/assembly factor-like uncharacterized protein
MKRLLFSLLASCFGVICIAQDQFWHRLGAPEGGYVTYLEENQSGSVYLIDYYQRSLWVYDDALLKWQKTNPDSIHISGMAGQYAGRMYAFASESNGSNENNIYYSDDQGTTWIASGFELESNRFWVDPDGTLYALADRLLFRSDDQSGSWELILDMSNEEIFTFDMGIGQSGKLFVTSVDKIQMSDDKGENWETETVYEFAFLSRALIGSNNEVYALSTSGRDGNLYRSVDNGKTWEVIDLSDQPEMRGIFLSSNDDLYAISYVGLYRSIDKGETWEYLDFTEEYVEHLVMTESDEVYALTQSHVYYSDDNGITWAHQSDLEDYVNAFCVDAAGNLYLGTYYNGVSRSTDKGKTWNSFNTGYENVVLDDLIVARSGRMYATSFNATYMSDDKSNTWQASATHLEDLQLSDNGTLYAMIDNKAVYSSDNGDNWVDISWPYDIDPRRIIVGENNMLTLITVTDTWHEDLYFSYDYGDHWKAISTNMTSWDFTLIEAVHITPMGNYLINIRDTQEFGNTCYLSTDQGATWQELALSGAKMMNLENDGVLVADLTSFFLGQVSSLSYSKDDGSTWELLENEEGTTEPIRRYFFDEDRDNIYAIDNNTLSMSEALVLDWQVFSENEINNDIKHLSFSPDGSLFALSTDNRLYSSNADFSIVGLLPSGGQIANTKIINYPNPFNHSTTFEYSLSSQEHVSLSIYNIHGQLVKTLVDTNQNAGTHQVKWVIDEMNQRPPAGAYAVRISIGSSVQSGLLMVQE